MKYLFCYHKDILKNPTRIGELYEICSGDRPFFKDRWARTDDICEFLSLCKANACQNLSVEYLPSCDVNRVIEELGDGLESLRLYTHDAEKIAFEKARKLRDVQIICRAQNFYFWNADKTPLLTDIDMCLYDTKIVFDFDKLATAKIKSIEIEKSGDEGVEIRGLDKLAQFKGLDKLSLNAKLVGDKASLLTWLANAPCVKEFKLHPKTFSFDEYAWLSANGNNKIFATANVYKDRKKGLIKYVVYGCDMPDVVESDLPQIEQKWQNALAEQKGKEVPR